MTVNDQLTLLLERIKAAPSSCGVYQFMDNKRRPLYIGKSINIKQRLYSHYYESKQSPKRNELFNRAHFIEWQPVAGELGALLLESKLIKKYLPLFNRRLRRKKKLFTLTINALNAYHSIVIQIFNAANKSSAQFGLFTSYRQAREYVKELIKNFHFCDYIEKGFNQPNRPCFSFQLGKCKGACVQHVSAEIHNYNLAHSLKNISFEHWPFDGKIAIKEVDKLSNAVNYHIVDEWYYQGTVNALDVESVETVQPLKRDAFDVDDYLTLKRFLFSQDIIHL